MPGISRSNDNFSPPLLRYLHDVPLATSHHPLLAVSTPRTPHPHLTHFSSRCSVVHARMHCSYERQLFLFPPRISRDPTRNAAAVHLSPPVRLLECVKGERERDREGGRGKLLHRGDRGTHPEVHAGNASVILQATRVRGQLRGEA